MKADYFIDDQIARLNAHRMMGKMLDAAKYGKKVFMEKQKSK